MKYSLKDYEIVHHGIEHSDYFQGCGVSFTDFEFVHTGIGDTEKEAFEDALESLAQTHDIREEDWKRLEWDKEHKEWSNCNIQQACGFTDEEMGSEDITTPYWHVSIRYNAEELN